MAETATDPLLQPFQLKQLKLRNRFLSTAHEPAYTVDGMPKDRYRLYHAEKARGGLALTMIGGSSVIAADSPQAFGNILLFKDEVVPWLKRLCEDVHDHGAAVMIQITHLGRRTSWSKEDWLPVIAPSVVREPAHRAFPKAMEDFDFQRVTGAYADAAERCQAADLDGLEFEMYGHLLDQFWSPATNLRSDQYGGSLENRLRFSFEVLRAVRARVGSDFIVGVRMVCDEDWDRGIPKHEGVEIAKRLASSGLIDFINVIRGHIETDEALSHVIPSMGAASAPHLDFAGEIRAATRFPVFHAARIQDVATARHAIASGKLDMVGMTRAHLADPHIARKVKEGRESEIRPCVGMGYCIDRIYFGGEALCIHNAATGREATMPHVIQRARGRLKKIVVVGAGPAGLEAARVAGERGHQVTVLEAATGPGGQVKLTAALKRRREIIGIIDWRMMQCEKRHVAFRFNALADETMVRDETPDIVIIATGGLPNVSFLDIGQDLATTSWDILSGAVKPAETVLLYDDNGAHAGMTAAEFIASHGAKLEFVTPERTVAPEVGGTNYPAYLRAFSIYQVGVSLNLRLTAIKRDGNQFVGIFHDEYGRRSVEKRADQIVVEHGSLPLDELYFALKPQSRNFGEIDVNALIENRPQSIETNQRGQFLLYRIGDAVASRNIHAAVYDALRLAKDF
jgi:N-methyl-L-proline demethylase